MEILDQFGIRASLLLNADVCRPYPEIIIEEGNRRHWVWMVHEKNANTF